MELALTLAVFLVGGILLDALARHGATVHRSCCSSSAPSARSLQMRYAYEQKMQRLEAERRGAVSGAPVAREEAS